MKLEYTSCFLPAIQDRLIHHLFDMQISCEIGHMMVVLVRVIKPVRLRIITYDMDDLDYMMFLNLSCYFNL